MSCIVCQSKRPRRALLNGDSVIIITCEPKDFAFAVTVPSVDYYFVTTVPPMPHPPWVRVQRSMATFILRGRVTGGFRATYSVMQNRFIGATIDVEWESNRQNLGDHQGSGGSGGTSSIIIGDAGVPNYTYTDLYRAQGGALFSLNPNRSTIGQIQIDVSATVGLEMVASKRSDQDVFGPPRSFEGNRTATTDETLALTPNGGYAATGRISAKLRMG